MKTTKRTILREWIKIAFMLLAISVINFIIVDYTREDYYKSNEQAREKISQKIDSINVSIQKIERSIPKDFSSEVRRRTDSVIYIYRTYEVNNQNYPNFQTNDSANFNDDMRVIRSARFRPYTGID